MLKATLQKLKGSARSLFCFALICALLLYTSVIVYLYINQDKLVFPGAKTNEKNVRYLAQNFPDSEMHYHSGDASLQGWQFNASAGKNILFYYGGNADELSNAAMALAPLQDFHSVLVNYRGYGNSSGKPSEEKLYTDALKIFDAQIKQEHPEKVFVIGRSLGTGVATYVAAHRPVDALVLVTPFDSLVAVGQHRYPFVPVARMIRSHFDSLLRADKLTMPTLVLMAENDTVVPHKNTERLLQKLPAVLEVKTLAGTSHGNIVDSPEYLPTIEKFLDGINTEDKNNGARNK
jgi:pimeloyl-ACP methyl ester carboxylesterase